MDSEEFIVSSIRLSHNPSESIYTSISDSVAQLKGKVQLELYDRINDDDNFAVPAADGRKGTAKEYGEMLDALIKKVGVQSNAKSIKLSGKEYAQIVDSIIPELEKAADTFLRAFLSGAPIVVRFHNDGDGAAGAIALYRSLSALEKKFCKEGEGRAISWQMNKGIAYTQESFYMDRMLFESYKSIEKPLLLITDFGTSPESEAAMELAKKTCDIIWFDHHLAYSGFPKELVRHYINAFDFGGDSSITAGLECCIFAELLSGNDEKELREASLISDYSKYADFGYKDGIKTALILDFLTSGSNSSSNSKPKQMDAILGDKARAEDMYAHASNALEEAINTGIRNIRTCKSLSGINISVLDFAHIAKLELGYPLPGRYSSKLQSHIESINNGNTITVVHYGNYISIRVSSDISDSVDLLRIIERLKVATNGALLGGGHKQAASIKTTEEKMKSTIHMLLVELGVKGQF